MPPGRPTRSSTESFERASRQLRPLGEAYLLRHFGGSLNQADAEDVVAEVLFRIHRKLAAGWVPENLRAVFLASVRNAGIDMLRSRAVRPTVDLNAVIELAAPVSGPGECAVEHEDATRLQEAVGRMRPNYREAILLRFGRGMTVPEIASHLGISLPAAKKLVSRATAQAKKRLVSVEDAEFASKCATKSVAWTSTVIPAILPQTLGFCGCISPIAVPAGPFSWSFGETRGGVNRTSQRGGEPDHDPGDRRFGGSGRTERRSLAL